MALLVWLLLDITVDVIGGQWETGYLLEGISMTLFLAYQLAMTLLRYGMPGDCRPDRVVGSIAWAAGWVVLAVCRCQGAEASVCMAAWHILFPIFHPED